MAIFDYPLDELRVYQPDRKEPRDFDQFWASTLETAREKSFPARFELVDYRLSLVDCFDVTFAGFDGQEIKAWFILPKNTHHPLPCIVQFQGYST
ncbi:MAG: acetylxylan esterase, partial [Chloroflexi bacterium]|nr:acetylxylan esterase [Chloroflexota bacterium]